MPCPLVKFNEKHGGDVGVPVEQPSDPARKINHSRVTPKFCAQMGLKFHQNCPIAHF